MPAGQSAFAAKWRKSAFVEYYFNSPNAKCDGYITEDTSNNFIGIRSAAHSRMSSVDHPAFVCAAKCLLSCVPFVFLSLS